MKADVRLGGRPEKSASVSATRVGHPLAAACVELVLVLAGAFMYWRAAMEVSAKAGRNGSLASLSGAMLAVFGLLVLYLDYTS